MNITKVSPEFAIDLIGLINSLKGLTYNAKVSYGNTKFEYVTLDKILETIKENNNFAVLEPLGTNENGQAALQIILVHKSGEAITSDYYVLRVPEGAKKQDEGAAITYTKRYALGSFLGICTDEDNDANPDGNGMNAKTPKGKAEDAPFDTTIKYAAKEQIEYLEKAYGERIGEYMQKVGIQKLNMLPYDKAEESIKALEDYYAKKGNK